MKKLYYVIFFLLLLSFLSTAVIIILSPDIIPAHYNASGQVDRFGSKYEHLIFPGFSLVMAVFLLLLQKYQQKKNAPEFEQKVLLYTLIFSLILFTGLGIFFGVAAINYSAQNPSLNQEALVQFTAMGMGLLFVLLGNIMPKARRNAIFGLRTKWSMANDAVWQKSQRFGGMCSVVCGLLMILLAVFLPGKWNLILLTALVVIWIAACIIASYRFWKADTK